MLHHLAGSHLTSSQSPTSDVRFTLSNPLALECLRACRVAFAYDNHPVLENIDLTLEPGSLCALVGTNGAGKSTLLQLLQGQLAPQRGLIFLGERPIRHCRGEVALMPQRGRINWSFPITVRELVGLGSLGGGGRTGCCDREAALQRVGLSALGNQRLDALSGGQQQRALLARALVQPARILLLDEPCAAIDPPSRQSLLQLLRQLADAGHTMLVSSHDWGEALDVYDRVIVLDRMVLADGTPPQVRRALGSLSDMGNHYCG